jgi:hypothetical protein
VVFSRVSLALLPNHYCAPILGFTFQEQTQQFEIIASVLSA